MFKVMVPAFRQVRVGSFYYLPCNVFLLVLFSTSPKSTQYSSVYHIRGLLFNKYTFPDSLSISYTRNVINISTRAVFHLKRYTYNHKMGGHTFRLLSESANTNTECKLVVSTVPATSL